MRYLQELENLKPFLDEISNGVTIADATVKGFPLTFVNKAFERMTGYSSEEALGRNCRFLQGEDSGSHEVERLREALRRSEPCHLVLRNYRRDQTVFLNELKLRPIFDADGQLVRYVGIQNDVTSVLVARTLQRRAGTELSQSMISSPDPSELELPALGASPNRRSGGLGVAVCDHRGEFRYVNPSLARMASRSAKQLVSSSVFDLFDSDWLSEALVSTEPAEREWRPARLVAEEVASIELSQYRVVPGLGAQPFFVLLVRSPEDGLIS